MSITQQEKKSLAKVFRDLTKQINKLIKELEK